MSAPQRPGEGSGPAGLLTLSGTHSSQGTFWGSSLVLQPPASPCATPQGQGPTSASCGDHILQTSTLVSGDETGPGRMEEERERCRQTQVSRGARG